MGDSFRDGDWYCKDCEAHNFSRRRSCFKCHAPKDGSGERGSGGSGERGSGERGRPTSRHPKKNPGDWDCPSCKCMNFARRTECFRCKEPQPYEGGSSRDRGGYDDRGRGPPRRAGHEKHRGSRDYESRKDSSKNDLRPGDWHCEGCGTHNFARRRECFKCRAARPSPRESRNDMRDHDRGRERDYGHEDDYRRDPYREPRGPPPAHYDDRPSAHYDDRSSGPYGGQYGGGFDTQPAGGYDNPPPRSDYVTSTPSNW